MSQLSTTFPNHLDKTIKEVFYNASEESIKNAAYNQIFRVYDTTEYVEGFTSDEGIDDFTPIAEAQDLDEAKLCEGFKTTLSAAGFAKKLIITYEMIEKSRG